MNIQVSQLQDNSNLPMDTSFPPPGILNFLKVWYNLDFWGTVLNSVSAATNFQSSEPMLLNINLRIFAPTDDGRNKVDGIAITGQKYNWHQEKIFEWPKLYKNVS